ncbi:MAG: hypothetical protein ACJAUG_000614 [Halioglobus sp.]
MVAGRVEIEVKDGIADVRLVHSDKMPSPPSNS